MYKGFIKRVLDFTIALLGLILLCPVFLLVTIGLLIANNGKPFFFQKRPGLHEKLFNIIKFKTMNDRVDSTGRLLPDADRITKMGAFVRKTSLDEIPQLINVLLGDMSLVGPRPLLPQYLPLYSEKQRQRHNVRPGITGWAQVNGRNAISWKEKFELDLFYVERSSFRLDLKIVYLTFVKVLKRSGINSSDGITMESFNGNN